MDVRELRDHLILSGGESRDDAQGGDDAVFDQANFGATIRRLRSERGWTLRDLSERSKISQSALSRVETGQITLSFDRAHALARALEADFSVFLKEMGSAGPSKSASGSNVSGWRSLTRRGEGHHVTQRNADYEYLCGDFLYRKTVTGIALITAMSLDDHGPFVTHPGEEFVHVLEGAATLATEYYAPVTLEAGDSLQFDSMTPHAWFSAGERPARILFTVTDPRWSQQ
jgi:transcriptional regulator with XRE-family HTH domain